MSKNMFPYHVAEIIKQYNSYFQRQLKSTPGVWKKSNEDHYCFIPSRDIESIIDTLYEVYKLLYTKPPLKFLDCGCGIGNIMLIARTLGYDVYGIEYEKATCKIARDLTWEGSTCRGQKRNNSIIHGDITTFEHYADYDVIYYYTPIKKHSKRTQFIKKLTDNVKIGSIIVSYGGSHRILEDSKFKKVDNIHGVYQKVSDKINKGDNNGQRLST